MATLSKLFIASSALASLALAAPFNQARDIVYDVVTETVWTTLDVTTTIYPDATQPTFAASAPANTTVSATPMISSQVEASTPITLMTSSSPAPAPVTSSAVEPALVSSSTVVPAPISSSTQAAELSTTSAMTSAPAITSAAALSATTSPSTTTTQSGSAVAAAAIAASSSGTCEGTSNACVGDVTHWDGGLGACGTVVDTNSDYAIALPFEFMGPLSNTNPFCQRTVTLLNPTSGTTVQATVMDKCEGCVDRAIDCTDVLFNAITDNLGNGRMSGIEWWLN